MNDVDVYGQIIAKVPAPELVQNGYIIPPKVIAAFQMRLQSRVRILPSGTVSNLLEILNENPVNKILICAKATKHIIGLLSQTDFAEQCCRTGIFCDAHYCEARCVY